MIRWYQQFCSRKESEEKTKGSSPEKTVYWKKWATAVGWWPSSYWNLF